MLMGGTAKWIKAVKFEAVKLSKPQISGWLSGWVAVSFLFIHGLSLGFFMCTDLMH